MYTRTEKNKKRLFIIIVVVVIISVLATIITLKRKWNRKTNFDEEISKMMTDETFMSLSMDNQAEQIIEYLNDAADDKIVNSDGNTILKDSIIYDDASGTIFYCVSQDGMYAVSLKSANTMEFQSDANLICNETSNGDMDWDDMDETDSASILLLYGAEHDDHMENYIELIDEYGEQGINVQIDDSVTVDDYMTKMDDADIVIIASHGIYTSYKKYDDGFIIKEAKIVYSSMICTDDVVTDEKNKLYRDDINNYRIVRTNSIGTTEQYYWILPEFFTYHYGANDMNGEYIHLSCCQSFGADMRNGSEVKTAYCDLMASAFIDCGAEVVAGYYNTVFKSYDYSMLTEILNNLFDNKSISDAIMAAEYENGTDDGEFAQKIGWLNEDNEYYDEVKTRLDESGAAHIEMLGNEQYVINVQLLNTGNITGDEAQEIETENDTVDYRTVILEGQTLDCVDSDTFDNQIKGTIAHYCIYNFNNIQFKDDTDTLETVTVMLKSISGRCISGNIGSKLETSNMMLHFMSCEYEYRNNFETCEGITPDTIYDEIDRKNTIENAGYKTDNGEINLIYFYDENGVVDVSKYVEQYYDIVNKREISGDEYYLAILSWMISPYAASEGLMDNRDLIYHSPFVQKGHDKNAEIYDAMVEYLCNTDYITESSAIEVLAYADLFYKVRREEIQYFYEDIVYPADDGTIECVHHYLCWMQGDNYAYRQYNITQGEAMDIVCDRWEPLGSATIYWQSMVEEDGKIYYHFIVGELNTGPYDEVYIDAETGECKGDKQESGEQESGNHDGIYYLESMSYAGEVMSASELGMEDIGLKVSYGRCEFIGGESVGLANSGSSDIIFSDDTVTIIDSDGSTIYGKYDGDAIILDASGVEMIFSKK